MLRNNFRERTPEATPPPAQEQASASTEGSSQQNSTATQGSSTSSNTNNDESTNSKKTIKRTPHGNVEKMKDMRNYIISLSYKFNNEKTENSRLSSAENTEIIDIINDYPWIVDTVVNTSSDKTLKFDQKQVGTEGFQSTEYAKKTNIPVCYITERKSAVNSTVANVLSMVSTLNDITQITSEGAAALSNGFLKDFAKEGSKLLAEAKTHINNFIKDSLPGFAKLLSQNNLNDEILNPYRFLYVTADTGKRYAFPLTNNQSASFLPGKLTWGNPKGGQTASIKKVLDALNSNLYKVSGYANLMRNIAYLNNEDPTRSDDNGNAAETIKSFSYPETGDSLTINFTLYNTTKRNAWKNNFRFLYLFAMRNLPFKTETISFVPPLLYDIIIPGVKRMPVSCLTTMKVDPMGMTRILECPNFIDSKKGDQGASGRTIPVNVPEAWVVTLTFQSLIAPSANLLLANTVGEMDINAALDFGDMTKLGKEEIDTVKAEIDAERDRMQKLCKQIEDSKKFDKAMEEMKVAESNGYKSRMGYFFESVADKHVESLYSDYWDKEKNEFKPGYMTYICNKDPFLKEFLNQMNIPITEKNESLMESYFGKLEWYSSGMFNSFVVDTPSAEYTFDTVEKINSAIINVNGKEGGDTIIKNKWQKEVREEIEWSDSNNYETLNSR